MRGAARTCIHGSKKICGNSSGSQERFPPCLERPFLNVKFANRVSIKTSHVCVKACKPCICFVHSVDCWLIYHVLGKEKWKEWVNTEESF